MAEHIWHIQNCSLFRNLTVTQLSQLEVGARMRAFPRDSAVYLPSDNADCAFLLAEGRIRICSVTPEGKQAILAFVEPGEVFGELAIVQSGEREERAEAVVKSTVVQLPGRILRELVESSASLCLGVTKLIGMRRRRVERRLKSLLFRSNRERLVQLLIDLVQQYGQRSPSGIQLGIKLSHQDLASIIGCTRETVTTLLGEMQLEGLVQVSRRRVVVRDLQRLADEVGVAPPHITPTGRSEAPTADLHFRNLEARSSRE
jgi:CRP/FNR family transcriptional regulator, cyclic AMP receptor protein